MSSTNIQSDHTLIGSTYVTFVNDQGSGLISKLIFNFEYNGLSKRQLYSVGDDILAIGLENRKGSDVKVFYYYNITKHTYKRPPGTFARFVGGFFIALIFFLCALGFVSAFNGNRWTDDHIAELIISLFFSLAALLFYFAWAKIGKMKKVFLAELDKLNIRL
ncbi:MAG: hypothetical protein LBS26_03860 [Campylobacteraceae bacterium]|jgi:hypothetical protein|nr:hypothetical protein [Campylobacteraceae bacterium]